MAESKNAFIWDEIPEAPEKAPFVLLVEAAQGQGKTHLALTFPQPIFHLDTENRGDKVAAKFKMAGTQVYRKVCNTFEDIRQTLVQGIFPHFAEGTVVIDSGSDLQTYAELEWLQEAKKDKVYPLVLWSKVFAKIDQLVASLRNRGFYVVITARLKPEYKNDEKTGALVMEGYKRLPYLADIHLRLENGQAVIFKNGFRNSPTERTTPLDSPCFDSIVQELIVAEHQRRNPLLIEASPPELSGHASQLSGGNPNSKNVDPQLKRRVWSRICQLGEILSLDPPKPDSVWVNQLIKTVGFEGKSLSDLSAEELKRVENWIVQQFFSQEVPANGSAQRAS